ncbi:MAG: 4-oxalocrotonate tautomerase [Candidatus Omnitrophica bacterium]|nr:4-oxalocrotonate tautomerase [Candidatus Omnitrophota bacterium]
MPVVKIEMLEGRTKQQKAQLVQAVTQALVDIAKAKPESVTVVFSEYSKENWAQGGRLLSD